MADYVEVTRSGWLDRIAKSIAGTLFGLLLFLGSFALLWWNEGKIDLSKVAQTALEVNAEKEAPAGAEGSLVCISGIVSSGESLDDGLFLKTGNYITIHREAEVYAWVEKKNSETHKDSAGGGETTTTTYNYEKKWVSSADNSNEFKKPEGHDNSQAMDRLVQSEVKTVPEVKMGLYTIQTDSLDLPGTETIKDLKNDVELVSVGDNAAAHINGQYISIRKTKSDSAIPLIGDERVSYSVLKADFKGSAFGKLNGSGLDTFMVIAKGGDALKNNDRLFRIFKGDKASAVATLHGEFVFWLWILRLIGFLMMWIGLAMIFDPISKVLDIVGFIGSMSRFLINTLLFAVAFALSLVTIIVAAIAHSVVVLAVVIPALLLGLVFFIKSRKKNS